MSPSNQSKRFKMFLIIIIVCSVLSLYCLSFTTSKLLAKEIKEGYTTLAWINFLIALCSGIILAYYSL